MAHRCVRKFRLAKPASLDARHFHTIPARHDAPALPLAEHSTSASGPSSSRRSPLDVLREQKVSDLRSLLSLRTPSPNRVWGNYLELLQFYGSAKVPLDIHQSVLRKCAPPAAHVRAIAARRVAAGQRYKEDMLYESRYQRIIRNIRSAGDTPSLSDYHCVLDLFAAVGNHNGAMMVLAEIGRVGLVKDPRTYGLCLQALCHRLTLPVWHLDRPALVDEVTEHCMTILNEMADRGVPYAPVNVDLAFRILKETMNMEGFTMLMRNAYGIDLAYPDRSPLEYWGKVRDAATEVEAQDGQSVRFPTQLPFTLATFNTALDYLARSGNVTKLVQTFEVITNPLPSTTSNPNSFDDEDDEDFGVSNPQVAPYRSPHVQPNTTSFRTLLRGVCDAGHVGLARHYVLVAIAQERQQDYLLLRSALTQPPDELPAPRLSINRNLLLPVFHLANRQKDVELLRWITVRIKRAVRWHRHAIKYYTSTRTRWVESGVYVPKRAVETDLEDDVGSDLPSAASTSRFSSFFSPSSSSRQASATFDASSSSNEDFTTSAIQAEEGQKTFDVDLHLKLLERELLELEDLERHADVVLGRSTQRLKERLGRRVWNSKDIFLRDIGRRTTLPKAVFRENVNFRSQSEVEARQLKERSAKTRERPTWGAPPPLARTGPMGEQYTATSSVEREERPPKSSRES
ncbi:hypothetical protein DICSQDRAFT_103363 [Dichomitus squalens LYAD-421 SS1]|uniref:uncharacterized protein n=1 Tax=Dichomitus squalens (strain LYAD-421) TaxID=732165 RepID=UPI0004412D72|nr:uncharacterized protein DICSQDRAFT_103363 [Dichomitus squalens LYAD-421 SS1]EJF62958.1 hypothetical protein DICSQDRAFT_103363 [Dichomitus squalens LYAD-421 SS1]